MPVHGWIGPLLGAVHQAVLIWFSLVQILQCSWTTLIHVCLEQVQQQAEYMVACRGHLLLIQYAATNSWSSPKTYSSPNSAAATNSAVCS